MLKRTNTVFWKDRRHPTLDMMSPQQLVWGDWSLSLQLPLCLTRSSSSSSSHWLSRPAGNPNTNRQQTQFDQQCCSLLFGEPATWVRDCTNTSTTTYAAWWMGYCLVFFSGRGGRARQLICMWNSLWGHASVRECVCFSLILIKRSMNYNTTLKHTGLTENVTVKTYESISQK